MSRGEYFPNVRRTARREAQVAALAEQIGVGEPAYTAVVDFALSLSLAVLDSLDASTVVRFTEESRDSTSRKAELAAGLSSTVLFLRV